MEKLRSLSSSSLALICVLAFAVSAFAQEVSQNTQNDVVAVTRVESTDTLLDQQPKATTVKSEPKWDSTSTTKPDTATASDEWHFEVRPYLWLAGVDGTLRVDNTTADVSKSSGDVLGALDFAAAVQLEAIHGNWRLMFDENYVNLGTTGTGPLGFVTVDVQPTINIFEFGGSYMAATIPNKKSSADAPYPPLFSAEILGGIRWFHLGLGLQANNNPPVEGSRNLFGPFVGNRFKVSPNRALTLIGQYTVGGSGASTKFAWSAQGLVDLRLRKAFSVAGGYRVLDMKADQVTNRVGFNGQMRGLVLYLTLYR